MEIMINCSCCGQLIGEAAYAESDGNFFHVTCHKQAHYPRSLEANAPLTFLELNVRLAQENKPDQTQINEISGILNQCYLNIHGSV